MCGGSGSVTSAAAASMLLSAAAQAYSPAHRPNVLGRLEVKQEGTTLGNTKMV